jgi:uncharacterized protein (DUF2062 family)
VGVIIPVAHTFFAALLAVPLRANVAIAAAFTLVVNPLTIPPLYYLAYRVGSWELRHDGAVVDAATAEQVTGELQRILFWVHQASGPIALGVVTIAVGSAVTGYLVAAVLWRMWLASKWRQRRLAKTARDN